MSRPARRHRDVTPKNAGLGPPGPCRRCKTFNGTAWVAADVNRYVSSCDRCVGDVGYWAALCPACEALMCEHRWEGTTCYCPEQWEVLQQQRELEVKLKELPPTAVPDIIEAEVVELPCTCSPPRYDGDDGYDRDCPQHGVGAIES